MITIIAFWVTLAAVSWGVSQTFLAKSSSKKYLAISEELEKTATYLDIEGKIQLAMESLELALKEQKEAEKNRSDFLAAIRKEAEESLGEKFLSLQKEVESLSEQKSKLNAEIESGHLERKTLRTSRDKLKAEIQEYKDLADGHPNTINMDNCRIVLDEILAKVGVSRWNTTLINGNVKNRYKAELGWLVRKGFVSTLYSTNHENTLFGFGEVDTKVMFEKFELQYAKWKKEKLKSENHNKGGETT